MFHLYPVLIGTDNLPHVCILCVAHLQLLWSLLWYKYNCYWMGGLVRALRRNTPLEGHRSNMGGKLGSPGGVKFCFLFFYVFTFLWGFLFLPSLVLLRVAGSWRQGPWGGMDLSQHLNFTIWSASCNIGLFFYSASCITILAFISNYE